MSLFSVLWLQWNRDFSIYTIQSLFQYVSVPCIRLYWNRLQHIYGIVSIAVCLCSSYQTPLKQRLQHIYYIVSISVFLYSLHQTFHCWFTCLLSLHGVIFPFLSERNMSLWTTDSNPKLFFPLPKQYVHHVLPSCTAVFLCLGPCPSSL